MGVGIEASDNWLINYGIISLCTYLHILIDVSLLIISDGTTWVYILTHID